jgi:hypothetical protein
MMRLLQRALVICLSGLCLLGLFTPKLLAWSDKGHKMVASIALRQLNLAEREKILAILKHHPRWKEEFADRMPEEVRTGDAAAQLEWSLQQAAIWPDIAREYENETRDKFHRSVWHYINHGIYLDEKERARFEKDFPTGSFELPANAAGITNVIQALKFTRRAMKASEKTSAADRAVYLAWIFHLVGDVHQPMHSTSMYSSKLFPSGDRGGNEIALVQRTNLHALWDSLPGNGKVTLKDARDDALKLMIDDEFKKLGEAARGQLDEEAWLKESQQFAQTHVYTDEVLAPLRNYTSLADLKKNPIGLSKDYLQTGGKLAKQRVIEAGYRLGAVLKEIAVEK